MCVCECTHVYFGARSVCALHRLEEIKRNTTKHGRIACGLLGKLVSCSSLSPLLLSALRPAAPSGRVGPRKYALLVFGLSAGFILSGSLLHVPARHGSKGRGGGRRRRTRGRMVGGVVYLGFRFSCLLAS